MASKQNNDLIAFLNENDIDWFPINLAVNGTVKTIGKIQHEAYRSIKTNAEGDEYACYMPSSSDFKLLPKEIIKQRQTLITDYKYIAISVEKVKHIDIDTDINTDDFLKIAKVAPYYKSLTKSYGKHIFITHDSSTDNHRPQFTTDKVELLNGGWSWARIDTVLVNSDKPIYHYDNIDAVLKGAVVSKKEDYELKLPKTTKTYSDDEIKAHCENISIEFIDTYDTWIRLVSALKSIDKEDLALEMSKRSSKYSDKGFQAIYNRPLEQVSIGTLMYYSKLSDADKYKAINSKYVNTYINNAVLKGTSERITQVFYEIYKEDFLFVEGDKNHYYFNGIVWKRSTLELRKKFISNEFKSYFCTFATEMNLKATHAEDDDERDKFFAIANSAQTLCSKLETEARIKDFLASIPAYIHKENVIFERNPSIFCFNNAVYDLKEMRFIQSPVRDDYMTFSTGYDYRPPTAKEVSTLKGMFCKIFPDEQIRTLYLTILATQLYGTTLEKFIIANGNGRNGKGFLNELMIDMLGEYGYTGSNSVLLSSIKQGVNVDIAKMENRRGIFFREPDASASSRLNSCTIKELTGGSAISARTVYSDKTKTEMKCTIVLECNERPKMSGKVDDAMLNRLIDVPFVSRFTNNASEVNESENVYLGDDAVKELEFKEKHRYALFEILLGYWKEYVAKKKNIDAFVPDSVKERVRQYLCDNTPILVALDEHFEKTDSAHDYVKIDDILNCYKSSDDYYNMSKAEKREITKKSMVEFCSKNPFTRKYYVEDLRVGKNGSRVRNVLTHYKKKVENDDDE